MVLKNIEAERGRMGLSKEALSRKLGITSKTYRSYINGSPIPSDIVVKMSKLFNCSTDYLLDMQTIPNPTNQTNH